MSVGGLNVLPFASVSVMPFALIWFVRSTATKPTTARVAPTNAARPLKNRPQSAEPVFELGCARGARAADAFLCGAHGD